jgi:hypothetical protein
MADAGDFDVDAALHELWHEDVSQTVQQSFEVRQLRTTRLAQFMRAQLTEAEGTVV